MSVQSPIYIMWGLMFPFPKNGDAVYDKCEPFLDSAFDKEPKPGVTVLWGEQYVAIGHVLARSGPHGDDLGTHSIPSMHYAFDPFSDPENIEMFAKWRTEIEEATKATGLYTSALGKSFGWHVIQNHR